MNPELSQLLKKYRLSEFEYELMKKKLGREPLKIEWPLFSSLWSEHCSYKSSKVHLRKFGKTLSQTVMGGIGENAGIVDLGQDEKIAFKMESHNHPSFIEPFQGAATGVGGILRDIFTMGARPIALADYLCFGDIQAPRMRALVKGVVSGISHYGNCVGVPTITGQTEFHSKYNNNILVNAMAVGLLTKNDVLTLSGAVGVGNDIVYVGAKTGKDGVHGAAMASESFNADSESKKPNVQIGDPYYEKLLIESCLEVFKRGLVEAIQDMGAAGLTSSSFEMASKGQIGMNLYLDKVPSRDSSILPEELLLSESQERMLLVAKPENLGKLKMVFEKWGLEAVKVGELIKPRMVNLFWKGELLTSIDPDILVEEAPVYERPYSYKAKDLSAQKETYLADQKKEKAFSIEQGSRRWIYNQYDQRVGLRTCHDASYDVGLLKLPSDRGLGMTLGCRPQLMDINAYFGARDAVVYSALQLALKSVKAMAVTDCLNFANPERPEVMFDFVQSVEVITETAIALNTPVVSGNVSFYNETEGKGIINTPAIGLVGLRKNVNNVPQDTWKAANSRVVLLEVFDFSFNQLLNLVHKNSDHMQIANTISTKMPLAAIAKLQDLLIKYSEKVLSSQAVGLGGLFTELLKMSFVDFKFVTSIKTDELHSLNKPTFYQFLFEIDSQQKTWVSEFETELKSLAVPFKLLEIGATQREEFRLESALEKSFDRLKSNYESSFVKTVEGIH